MDLTHIQRVPEDLGWTVNLPAEHGGEAASFGDADFGGVLPALLEALDWRSARGGGRRDWGWAEEGLERVDRGGTHGWWASVDLGTHLDADLFEDAEHGGVQEALLAALAWRRRVGGRRGGGTGGGGVLRSVEPGGQQGAARARPRGKGQRGKGKRPAGAAPAQPAEGGAAPPRRGRKRPRRPRSRPPQG